ncbi:MAG: EamA family transporter, partial [Tannerella sp.]|nr:EamA family transporter [Tannerella sp.]
IMAYSAYVWLLKIRPATEVGTHAYVNPFVAVLFGMMLGHEQVTWIQIVGLIIILLSVMMIERKK